MAQGKLHVRIAFSQEDLTLHSAGGQLVAVPGQRQRIDAEMLRDANARQLWQLLRSEEAGGLGTSIYVCGRTGFARSVMDAITAILVRFADGSASDREASARYGYKLLQPKPFVGALRVGSARYQHVRAR